MALFRDSATKLRCALRVCAEQSRFRTLAAGQEAVAIELDFVNLLVIVATVVTDVVLTLTRLRTVCAAMTDYRQVGSG